MRRLIFLFAMLLTGVVLYGVRNSFSKPNPEKLLMQSFKVDLKDFEYTIESFEDCWYPNGDGHRSVVFKFNRFTEENIAYLKTFNPQQLPINQRLSLKMTPNKIPKYYLELSDGYFLYKNENESDHRNFRVFIVDTLNKRAILYCQYM